MNIAKSWLIAGLLATACQATATPSFTPVVRIQSQPTSIPATLPTLAPSAATAPTFEVGVMVNTASDLGHAKEVGFSWARYRVNLATDGLDAIKAQIAKAHTAGFKVMLSVMGDRVRIADATYSPIYASAAADLARAGADAIEVMHYENLDVYFKPVSPEVYVAYLKDAYAAIKKANPATIVISGAPASTGYAGGACRTDVCDDDAFAKRMAAAGAAKYVDCIGVASYGSVNPPDVRSGGATGDHHSWYLLGTLDAMRIGFASDTSVCYVGVTYFVAEDLPIKKMTPGFSWANDNTLAGQVAWLPRAITVLRDQPNVKMVILANWDGRGYTTDESIMSFERGPWEGDWSALVRQDGSCPSCDAIKKVIAQK